MPKGELPVLAHGGHAEFLSAELDYEEMIALSGLYRLSALYDPQWRPEQRTELIGYSADLEELAQWVGEGWRASDPSGAAPICMFLARRARRRRSVIKLEHARHWLGRTQSPKGRSSLIRETAHWVSVSRSEVVEMHLPQNDKLVNIAAWRWLKKAEVQPDLSNLHLLTLARWGLENDAEGEWPEDFRDAVEMQLDDLARWNSEDLMKWLFANENDGDPHEKEQGLLHELKTATARSGS